jgi:hypothetical protein
MNEQDIEEVKEKVRKYFKECTKKLGEDDGPWPKVLAFGEEFPVVKAEIYKDGTMNVWPRKPLKYISVSLTLPRVCSHCDGTGREKVLRLDGYAGIEWTGDYRTCSKCKGSRKEP